jgi:hypothetical protein
MFRLLITSTLGMFAAFTSIASAGTISFNRSQTLEGWNERVFIGSSWVDLAPDVKFLVDTDINGDLRGFNGPTTTVWLASPQFFLEAGPLTISQLYLMDGGGAAPATVGDVSPTKSANGWAGIALRDQSGNFVLTYDQPIEWGEVTLSAQSLAPHVGKKLTLDIITMNNSSGDFLYVNRPISLFGTLASSSPVPEPASIAIFGIGSTFIMLARHRSQRRSFVGERA